MFQCVTLAANVNIEKNNNVILLFKDRKSVTGY